MVWNFVLVFLLGMFIGVVVVVGLAVGTLKVYVPDDLDEPPYLYVELDKPVSMIFKKKIVLFRVDRHNVETQK